MHVAVVIVAFGNAQEVVACIDAVAAQTHRDISIILCENGDAAAFDALEAALAAHRAAGMAFTILHAPDNPGYAGGINRCLKARQDADAWWILNPDTRPEPQALGALVTRVLHGDVSAAGGPLYWPNGRVQGHGGRWRSWMARAESIGNGSALSAPVTAIEIEAAQHYLLGASMLVTRDFLDRTGPMREDYFLYAEEVEWFVRARQRGIRIGFAPEARVQHGQGTTTGSADILGKRPRLPIYLDERNKLNVVRDTTPVRLVTAIPAAALLILLRYAKPGAQRQLGYALAGWWAGVRGERGKPRWLSGRN
jgi:N-acetylglucosaminyl-diphospho-decaprenol L-rhamnosyltransferase